MKKLLNKDFLNNFIGLSSMNFMALLVPIITMPVLSRSLGMADYGVFLLLLTINGFGQSFINYSFGITAVRELSLNKNDYDLRSEIYSEIVCSQCLLALLYIIIVGVLSTLDVFYLSTLQILLYSIPVLLSNILFSIWFHQGVSEIKGLATLNIIARFIFILYSVFYVCSADDLNSLMGVYSYSLFSASIISFIFRKYKYNLKLKISSPFKRLASGKDAFIGMFAPNLYSNVPGLALPSLVIESQYAIFAIAIRIINVSNMLQNVISRSLFPVLNNSKDYSLKDVLKINLSVSLFISICFLLFADFMINFLVGVGYEESVFYIKISIIGVIALAITDSIANGYYLVKRKDRQFRDISLYISFISFVAAVPLVYYFHSFGAVMTLIMARLLFAIAYITSFLKESK